MNYLVVSGLSIVSMIVFAVIANTAGIYAQQTPTNTTQVVVPSSTSSTSSTSPTTKLHLVKITSPTKGQQITTGKDLTGVWNSWSLLLQRLRVLLRRLSMVIKHLIAKYLLSQMV